MTVIQVASIGIDMNVKHAQKLLGTAKIFRLILEYHKILYKNKTSIIRIIVQDSVPPSTTGCCTLSQN